MAIDYAQMNQDLYEGDHQAVEQATIDALDAGHATEDVLQSGLIAGMSVVGEDFKHDRLYVPQVLVAARAMKKGLAVLEPLLTAHDASGRSAPLLLIGTVKGDLHDIGKNLVSMMAEGAGYKVVDLGVDVPVEAFLDAIDEHRPDVLGMSALLTTTMPYMQVVIDQVRELERHIPICVGGAPVSEMFAEEIGADGYSADAAGAVDLFRTLAPVPA